MPYIIVSSVKSVLIPPALKLASMAWSTMMTVETPFPAAHHLDIWLYARRPPGLEIKAGIEDIHTIVSSMKLYVYELKQAHLHTLLATAMGSAPDRLWQPSNRITDIRLD
ncbi:hypothetical protein CYMTET_4143 [Cymbomonas tetramitiformis]|uniref:Uncharacterized protein n=1 Tax=Cymbomonas tetramitiformis TaxID=36881 RepID=A0AAE0LK58_9CHLO|nr:hypothetical protein CYMTET_4143 [Cymbomonas tetramitiformis]